MRRIEMREIVAASCLVIGTMARPGQVDPSMCNASGTGNDCGDNYQCVEQANNSFKCELNDNAIAGLIAGLTVFGFLIVFFIILWFCCCRRKCCPNPRGHPKLIAKPSNFLSCGCGCCDKPCFEPVYYTEETVVHPAKPILKPPSSSSASSSSSSSSSEEEPPRKEPTPEPPREPTPEPPREPTPEPPREPTPEPPREPTPEPPREPTPEPPREPTPESSVPSTPPPPLVESAHDEPLGEIPRNAPQSDVFVQEEDFSQKEGAHLGAVTVVKSEMNNPTDFDTEWASSSSSSSSDSEA